MTSSPEPTRVLLVGDAFYGSIAAVRALRAAGYTPWLTVDQQGGYASRSRAKAGTVPVPSPKIDAEGFVREVAAAAARLSVKAVLPGAEGYLFTLAGRHADFAGTALGVPSREKVERATDKRLLSKLATAAGLQTPPTKQVVRGDREAVSAFGFPAIVKPQRTWIRNLDGSVSSYSASCVSTKQAAEEALERLPNGEGLVQPRIPGGLISIAGVSWEGEMVCAVHQASPRIWPVPCGVSAYAETIPRNPDLEQGVGRLLQALGWSGIFQAQFVRTSDGESYLIDLNPRVYGSLALAVASGLNLPGIWTDLLLGRRPNIGGYRVGARFRHEENDAHALVQMLREGKTRSAIRGMLPRRGTTHAIFSLDDPMPLLTTLTVRLQRLGRSVTGRMRGRGPQR
ncbi:MAG: ATP-grasp domain-containing protein [Actinomycetota bacterium]|nr:ATP-grasp domain-containing protein [Actinomycetota bacterium]